VQASLLFTAEEMALPKTVRQPVSTEAELYESANDAYGQMMDWLPSLGLEHYHQTAPFEPRIGYNVEGPILVTTPIKSAKRAREKMEADYDGDWSRLTDVVRATVAVDTVAELPDMVDALRQSGMKLARRPKDRFASPMSYGYRDAHLNVAYGNGHIGELQIHVKPMLQAREEMHGEYEKVQTIEARMKKSDREDFTADEKEIFDDAAVHMARRYAKAWADAGGGKTASMPCRAGMTDLNRAGELLACG
jgi:hypothetical protein